MASASGREETALPWRREQIENSSKIFDFLICEGAKIAAHRSQVMPHLPLESRTDLRWIPHCLPDATIWRQSVNYFCQYPIAYCQLVQKVRSIHGSSSRKKNLFLFVMLKDMALSGGLSKEMMWTLYHVCLLPKAMTTWDPDTATTTVSSTNNLFFS